MAELKDDINTVCEKAYHFALLLRQSKADFKLIVPPHDATVDESEEAAEELLGQEIGPPSKQGRIAFTVFGGLAKTVHGPGGEVSHLTLEKPHIVGYT